VGQKITKTDLRSVQPLARLFDPGDVHRRRKKEKKRKK
jgi:hypothetical protein